MPNIDNYYQIQCPYCQNITCVSVRISGPRTGGVITHWEFNCKACGRNRRGEISFLSQLAQYLICTPFYIIAFFALCELRRLPNTVFVITIGIVIVSVLWVSHLFNVNYIRYVIKKHFQYLNQL